MTEDKKHYVYILRCADGSLYTGWTTNLTERVHMHSSGKGAKYTRSHLPVALIYHETFADKSTALKREAEIKKMTRSQKEILIKQDK